ncbi:MAG TPA: hypothetical protein DCY50_04770 [Franconibacter helveticus]|nr:hypothetical protein [Franconibacter helveticus]
MTNFCNCIIWKAALRKGLSLPVLPLNGDDMDQAPRHPFSIRITIQNKRNFNHLTADYFSLCRRLLFK